MTRRLRRPIGFQEQRSNYDTDILLWSEDQAALLRDVAAGQHVNKPVDWENVIEEVESVGRSELSAVRSHILQAFVHDLKAQAWPKSRDVPHWQSEARLHREQAAEGYTSSMAHRIDLAKLYAKALRTMPTKMGGKPPQKTLSQQVPAATVEEYLESERD